LILSSAPQHTRGVYLSVIDIQAAQQRNLKVGSENMNKVDKEILDQWEKDNQTELSCRICWALEQYRQVLEFCRKYLQLLTLSLINLAYALVLIFHITGIIPVILSIIALVFLTHWWLMIIREAFIQTLWVEVFVQIAVWRGMSNE
jgi:hypothetical protein